MTSGPTIVGSDAAILARLVRSDRADLTPEAARALLDLRLDPDDLDRLHNLTVRNQDDALSPAERAELASYVRIGSLLDLMHAMARLALRRSIGSPRS